MAEKFKISNLDLYYGDFKALKNVNLEIEANKITAFIGPSGCGKSTLIKLLNGIINRANPIFHIGMNDQIVKHFGEMLDCARAQKSGFQAVLAGITMHTIGLIYSINKNQDYGSVSMQKIQEACVLMRENIYDKFTPEDIAESINMSYSNFRKSFKQYTGIAPHQYMLQLKLSKIKDLLSSTEMSIQDIAMKLNFESADYFSYFFRSKTGINPLSYRKEIEKQREKAKKNSH